MVLWACVVVALAAALAALARAGRLARRLDALNQSYWELRYDYTRLRSRVSRLEPEQAEDGSPDDPVSAAGPGGAPPPVSFVPLASLKRKEP